MRRSAHVTMPLGDSYRRLANGLADQDVAEIIAGIQELAGITGLLQANGDYVPKVMASFGKGVTYLRQHASLTELDDALAACGQAAGGATDLLLKAAFLAALGNLHAARAIQTRQLQDAAAAVTGFEQAIEALPDANPIMPLYRHRLAELRHAKDVLTAVVTEGPATGPSAGVAAPAPAPAPAPPAPAPAPAAAAAGLADSASPPLTPEQAKAFAALAEPMTGDVIPMAVRQSPKFIWAQRGLLVLSLACSADLAYAWLHGGNIVGTGDAIVATVGFWLTYLAAKFGRYYKPPG